VVIQSRSAQLRFGKVEAKRLDEMQFGSGRRRGADCIAGIRRDTRGVKQQPEHLSIMAVVVTQFARLSFAVSGASRRTLSVQ
jgi:hypothetical protein